MDIVEFIQNERNELRATLERIAHEVAPMEMNEAEWLRNLAREALNNGKG